MANGDGAALLEDAADPSTTFPGANLQIMLRRAALIVRNAGSITLDPDLEEAVIDVSSELGLDRDDAIRFIVREWMEKNTYLPVQQLDEDGHVDGSA
ncbi:CopG family transcriptional regulator [Rhizobium bangladeshense]|uniref:CopG family transcriptional regulator n=1 Tax=Rhizobium bangladeshense TaxID=1138189 RepID=UPI001A983BB2|nr:CopG family transcriptional regulator [Rhizobium bangladeshense]MBX4885371.1 CopG family transcriptional regulator [Rhizobium bangladeshense]MBX4894170.1 CopG family transcriptional regulator [Rhizobium bangladeshense]MBX4900085.1 CopG family transcriptional regulator [Rhizobium bangladeshense]MBX4912286.1 CopG family transcriptional regulator [Rhizobium bangladeshense]MBY3594526.1 CopG family transcriptional regulator [Rhizobium bangladeshense]